MIMNEPCLQHFTIVPQMIGGRGTLHLKSILTGLSSCRNDSSKRIDIFQESARYSTFVWCVKSRIVNASEDRDITILRDKHLGMKI